MANKDDHALIEHIRQSVPDLVALYRFGSQAKGTARRMQVISTGECLDAPNEPTRREFEMYVFSDYARLNEERREILKRISASGLVYG